MTYKRDNNDPNRTKTVRSPEEVKAMLMGSNEPDTYADQIMQNDYERAKWEAQEERTEIVRSQEETLQFLLSEPDYSTLSQDAGGRCPTCGRMGACCCQGCTVCPQQRMDFGKVSAKWAQKMNFWSWSGIDPREGAHLA